MSTLRVNRFENTSSVGYNSIVQSVRSQTGTYSNSSTALPIDNSTPQSSEGAEITALNTTITPTKIGNRLKVTAVINWGAAAAVSYAFALFKDNNANAVYTTVAALTGASYTDTIVLIYEETVASLSATTFKVRAGATAGNTIHINGSSSTGALFNGTCISSMTVEEIQV